MNPCQNTTHDVSTFFVSVTGRAVSLVGTSDFHQPSASVVPLASLPLSTMRIYPDCVRMVAKKSSPSLSSVVNGCAPAFSVTGVLLV